MGIVSTISEKCKHCYTCVRECPAKAIKVGNKGQAAVIEERCIACGNCVKVCAQKAKRIEDDAGRVEEMLAGPAPVFACLAPSFPAAYAPLAPGKIVAGLRALGFREVWEVAFGAELVSRAYARLFDEARGTGARVISTPCPAIVAYVEKYMPSLNPALAPIVSPMIAVARAIRRRHPGVRVVFIGPCIAKKMEVTDPFVRGDLDAILTFEELRGMFDKAEIRPERLREANPDGPPCYMGRSYPISGGLLKTAGLSTDILENAIVITEGKERALSALRELDRGASSARFFDILFCEGCISGPRMENELSVFARKEIIANYVQSQSRRTTPAKVNKALDEFKDLDMSRRFTRQNIMLPLPSEAELNRAFAMMKKLNPEDQLDCGACGYATCREKAIAVCQGLAEAEMCLPHLIEELQEACRNLERSKHDLESTHQKLVQTERLASMGQLSAGVAHELNNPLGTILIYSHMLLKQLAAENQVRPDLEMIVNEATRCKNIVRGLLDFARQSRVSKAPTDLPEALRSVVTIMGRKAEAAGIRIRTDIPADLPTMLIDGDQVKQVLINLVDNAIDAIGEGRTDGVVQVVARPRGDGRVEIKVGDNGCGIPPENLAKLFSPFFTTKELGKGTGLGLAIAYGIIMMHSGSLTVDSEVNRGSTFAIVLPVGEADPVKTAPAAE